MPSAARPPPLYHWPRLAPGTGTGAPISMDAMRPLFESIESPLLRDLFMELSKEKLNKELETYFDRACANFDTDMNLYETQLEEHKLEYTSLWIDYQSMLEDVIEDFCTEKGTTPKELFEICKEATTSDPVASAMLDVLVASSDYRCFVSMCVEKAKMRQSVAESKDGGGPGERRDSKPADLPAETDAKGDGDGAKGEAK